MPFVDPCETRGLAPSAGSLAARAARAVMERTGCDLPTALAASQAVITLMLESVQAHRLEQLKANDETEIM